MALDVATGNGQVALLLSAHFKKVIAIDESARQIRKIPISEQPKNIEFEVLKAEDIEREAESLDLIVVAQALHWLDLQRFIPKMNKLLKANGTFAFSAYGPEISCCQYPQVTKLLKEVILLLFPLTLHYQVT